MVGQYLRDQESVSPLGWACVVTVPQPSRTFMLIPIAVVGAPPPPCRMTLALSEQESA